MYPLAVHSIQSQLECHKRGNNTNNTEITHAVRAKIHGENRATQRQSMKVLALWRLLSAQHPSFTAIGHTGHNENFHLQDVIMGLIEQSG